MTVAPRSPFLSRVGRRAIGVYLSFSLAANGLWEVVHTRLYTIWHEATPEVVAFAILHCTAGDVLIAGATLALALMLAGPRAWPIEGSGRVAAIAVFAGVAYTILSEWLNVEVRGSWTYTPSMPVLPFTGTGLTPLAQWIVIPPLGLWLARRLAGASLQTKEIPA